MLSRLANTRRSHASSVLQVAHCRQGVCDAVVDAVCQRAAVDLERVPWLTGESVISNNSTT
ncbi:MAG TPA: hypothetical protein VF515_01460, partial [Candidatus Binatia bacterium]